MCQGSTLQACSSNSLQSSSKTESHGESLESQVDKEN